MMNLDNLRAIAREAQLEQNKKLIDPLQKLLDWFVHLPDEFDEEAVRKSIKRSIKSDGEEIFEAIVNYSDKTVTVAFHYCGFKKTTRRFPRALLKSISTTFGGNVERVSAVLNGESSISIHMCYADDSPFSKFNVSMQTLNSITEVDIQKYRMDKSNQFYATLSIPTTLK